MLLMLLLLFCRLQRRPRTASTPLHATQPALQAWLQLLGVLGALLGTTDSSITGGLGVHCLCWPTAVCCICSYR
jgi:hypothetical protein